MLVLIFFLVTYSGFRHFGTLSDYYNYFNNHPFILLAWLLVFVVNAKNG